MALILVVAPAYLKTFSIPDDVRKGLRLDRLENMNVLMPTKHRNNKWKTVSPKIIAHKLLFGTRLGVYH